MQHMKEALTSAPILHPPQYRDRAKPPILATDASPYGSGWMLGQEDKDGRHYTCHFGAKTFNNRERQYAQIKRELLAVCHTLQRE